MRIESEVIMTRLFSQICFIEEYQICGKKSNRITIQFLSNRAKLATYMKLKLLLQK